MKIRYDVETDSLVIKFRDTPIQESDEFAKNVIADFDAEGEIVSIEVLRASTVVSDTGNVEYERIA